MDETGLQLQLSPISNLHNYEVPWLWELPSCYQHRGNPTLSFVYVVYQRLSSNQGELSKSGGSTSGELGRGEPFFHWTGKWKFLVFSICLTFEPTRTRSKLLGIPSWQTRVGSISLPPGKLLARWDDNDCGVCENDPTRHGQASCLQPKAAL